MSAEQTLASLGLKLPDAVPPVGNYLPAVQVGNLLFLSGHGPRGFDGKMRYTGKVGKDLTLEEGYEAAKLVMLNCLGSIKRTAGSLDRVKRIVKVLGFINVPEGFLDTPKVLNGASDLLVQLYGENGRHARSAIGVSSLPNDMAVEIEMIVEFS